MLKKFLTKLKAHVKHRLTRIKTYLGVLMVAMIAAQPYMMGTPHASYFSYGLAICAFLISVMGGGIKENVSSKEETKGDAIPTLE